MNKQRPLLLLGLLAFIFAPVFYAWVTDPGEIWYKPYIVWALVIVGAYITQRRSQRRDA